MFLALPLQVQIRSSLKHVLQVDPQLIPQIFPNLVLRYPKVFRHFAFHKGRVAFDKLRAIDEHLRRQVISEGANQG